MEGGAPRRLPSFGFLFGFNIKWRSPHTKSLSAQKLFLSGVNHEYSRNRYN
jgi:hypothetical protein